MIIHYVQGILDDISEPFTNISDDFRNIFSASSKKFLIPLDEELKIICENFVLKEKERDNKTRTKFGNADFG